MANTSDIIDPIASNITENEKVLWIGRSSRLRAAGYLKWELAFGLFLVLLAYDFPPLIAALDFIFNPLFDAFLGPSDPPVDVKAIASILLDGFDGLVALGLGVCGFVYLWHYGGMVLCLGAEEHAVTNLRVISSRGKEASSIQLKHISLTQASKSDLGSALVLSIAGSKDKFFLLGIKDVQGAERAITAGLTANP